MQKPIPHETGIVGIMELLPLALAVVLGALLAGSGGQWFVDGLETILKRTGVPAALAGATLGAAATSTPEFFVAITAAAQGKPTLALGDALGSNVVNIGAILGLGLIVAKVPVAAAAPGRDLRAALTIPVLTGFLLWDGRLSRHEGILLIAIYAIWLAFLICEVSSTKRAGPHPHEDYGRIPIALGKVALGTILLAISGKAIVWGATRIAQSLGLPAFLVGNVMVALGTSLPELVTTLVSVRRGHDHLAVGTLIGSNIFNGSLIVGSAATICPTTVPTTQVLGTLVLGFLLTLFATNPKERPLGKERGILLLTCYVGMIVFAAFR